MQVSGKAFQREGGSSSCRECRACLESVKSEEATTAGPEHVAERAVGDEPVRGNTHQILYIQGPVGHCTAK